MKKLLGVLLVACSSFLSSCNFSVGSNKDFNTGLSYSYNGFSVEEVLLVGAENTAMSNNEVPLNSKIAIVAQGIKNYEMKDNKAFPGLMLSVTDNQGTSIINEADLFTGGEGYPEADASVIRGSITVGDPMKAGETYHVKLRLWDKLKPENELTAEVDVVVK